MGEKNNMQVSQIQRSDFITINITEIKLLLATQLYEQGKLSLEQSAQLAGLSKRAFVELFFRKI